MFFTGTPRLIIFDCSTRTALSSEVVVRDQRQDRFGAIERDRTPST